MSHSTHAHTHIRERQRQKRTVYESTCWADGRAGPTNTKPDDFLFGFTFRLRFHFCEFVYLFIFVSISDEYIFQSPTPRENMWLWSTPDAGKKQSQERQRWRRRRTIGRMCTTLRAAHSHNHDARKGSHVCEAKKPQEKFGKRVFVRARSCVMRETTHNVICDGDTQPTHTNFKSNIGFCQSKLIWINPKMRTIESCASVNFSNR